MTKCISSFAKDLVTATWRAQKMLLTYNKLLHEEKGTDFDQSIKRKRVYRLKKKKSILKVSDVGICQIMVVCISKT